MGQGSQGSNSTFNLISMFFLALTAFVCLIALLVMADIVPAGPLEPATDVPLPTSVLVNGQLPSATPSNTLPPTVEGIDTPTRTPSPTWTKFPTNTPTLTLSPTRTIVPTSTLTFTPSFTPTFTPSVTFTASPTETTAPPTPTEDLSNILFTPQPGMPIYRDAFLHPGCEWFGVAGQVVGQNGEPLIGLTIKVTGDSGTAISVTGSNTGYGTSGFEAQLGLAPLAGTYTIQIVAADQVTQLSSPILLNFDGSCERNMALINFIQAPPQVG